MKPSSNAAVPEELNMLAELTLENSLPFYHWTVEIGKWWSYLIFTSKLI